MHKLPESTQASALLALQARIQGCRLCQEQGYIPEARPQALLTQALEILSQWRVRYQLT